MLPPQSKVTLQSSFLLTEPRPRVTVEWIVRVTIELKALLQ